MELVNKKKVIFILSILGLAISSYLTYYKFSLNTKYFVSCGFASCAEVQTSKYSELLGIPVAVYGVLYYGILMYLISRANNSIVNKIWVVWGILFSSYLTGLEVFVIKATCPWCLASYIVIVLMNLIYFIVPTKEVEKPMEEESARDNISS